MKITVDRPLEDSDHLTFIIMVDDPHPIPFRDEEFLLLNQLDECQRASSMLQENNKIKTEVEQAIHRLKGVIFERMISSLRFSIENQLEEKFNPICQEIYNWLYDKQTGPVKKWLQEFDPQRTKYYFDNDKTVESDCGDEDGKQVDMHKPDVD